MEGISGYLRRAREKHLLESPTKIPSSSLTVARENEENEDPQNAQDGPETGQLKSCLKPISKPCESELPTSSARWAPAPPELSAPAVLTDRRTSNTQANAVAKSVVWAADTETTDTQEAHAVALESSSEAGPLRKDLSACEFVDDAFAGLPGMDVYRDVAGSEDEAALSAAEYGDEEQSEDSEDDTFENLTSLIATTKELALGDEPEPRGSQEDATTTTVITRGRRSGDAVRARFIGGLSNDTEQGVSSNTLPRQSVSEMEESDIGRQSEVLLSNFPLLLDADSGKEDNNDEEDEGKCFTPTKTISEEQRANNTELVPQPEDEVMMFFEAGFSLFASDSEVDNDQKVAPTPANTPFGKAPSSPLFRRSSAVCTPKSNHTNEQQNALSLAGDIAGLGTPPNDKPFIFRRSSVVYTPNFDDKRRSSVVTTPTTSDTSTPSSPTTVVHLPALRRSSAVYSPADKLAAPHTPPRVQDPLFKPPKTEAAQKTKSRIEVGSVLLGVCHSAPSAQLGAHPGSMTAPPKVRVQSRIPVRRVVAVADTNVLLHHRTLVENTQNYPNVTLVIPSAVVRELDGLKNGTSLTARDAREALHSLRKLLKGAQSRSTIKFQNIDEVPESRSYRGRARSNDDRILDCCLYYAEKAEEGQKVVLLTNDVALQVKAESFGQRKCALTTSGAGPEPSFSKNGPPLILAMGMRAFYETEVWQSA